MKTTREYLIKEIGVELFAYLKSGKLNLSPYIRQLNLNIDKLEQLLQIHYIMKEEVQNFIRLLGERLRRVKTSTITSNELFFGGIKGSIDWQKTITERYKRNYRDNTIFSCNEKSRSYDIKENLVLKEYIEVLYRIFFEYIDFSKLETYEWLNEGAYLKGVVKEVYEKNIYLSKIKNNNSKVTDRMIEDTIKNRNQLYSESARLLKVYRKLMNFHLEEEEVLKLFSDTFIYADKDETLFELYWVTKIIRDNAENHKLFLMDGNSSLVASWEKQEEIYELYHDSTGGYDTVFQVSLKEIEDINNPYIRRKLQAINKTSELAAKLLGNNDENRYKYLWRGRPDIIINIRDKESNNLKKLLFGEVKYTLNKDYALEGLKELMEYAMFVKDISGNYLFDISERHDIQGILFIDDVDFNKIQDETIRVVSIKDQGNVII